MSEALVYYEINPVYFRDQPAYTMLEPGVRLFFRELMDLLWLSEERFRMPYDPACLAEKLSVSEEFVEESVDTLTSDACGLLDLVFGLDNPGYILSCPYLESTKKRMVERSEREQAVGLAGEIKKANTVTPLQRVMGGDDNMEPTVGYLDSEEISVGSDLYSGWLPTAQFASSGQVFYVRKILLENLRDRFPGRDLQSDFEDMFRYLMTNPDRRPFYGVMNRFVARWLTRNKVASDAHVAAGDEAQSIDDAFEALLNEEENFG